MTKAALFHTSAATLGLFQNLTATAMPEVEIVHFVEESMIREVMKNGGPTPEINARIAGYVQAAEKAGCAIFMTACSSIGASVEQCQFLTRMPVTRIDEAMIEEAIEKGPRIAVLATVETTLKPTLEYVECKARAAGKEIAVQPTLMAEAFKVLLAGDNETHDRIVSTRLREALGTADVVVLAQASMARVMNDMPPSDVPVLTSPERGIQRLKERIKSLQHG